MSRENSVALSFERGEELFQRLVRGDGIVGLIDDVAAVESEMMDALWTAAAGGHAEAYERLGDCFMALLRPIGAFEGIEPPEGGEPRWSDEAKAVRDDNDAVEAALRGYAEAARLGRREAISRFAQLARYSSEENKRRASSLLEGIDDITPDELYLRGLVQNWLSELEASAETHLAAAEAGSADAMFELHVLYVQGLGVERDEERSAEWLEKAAAAGQPRALYNVGAEHASGKRGEPNMAKAAEYYEKAARAGHGRAPAMLAIMILRDEIPGTAEQAGKWLDLAEDNGFPALDLLEAAGFEDPRAG